LVGVVASSFKFIDVYMIYKLYKSITQAYQSTTEYPYNNNNV